MSEQTCARCKKKAVKVVQSHPNGSAEPLCAKHAKEAERG